jgi:hypothetical protein
MTPVARANHLSGCAIEGREQRSSAVAQMVVGAPLGHSRAHGEQRLGGVQRLNL